MNTIFPRIVIAAALFGLIFFFGFWLSRVGKPYNWLLFNLHKLISLGTAVFIGVLVFRASQVVHLSAGQIAVVVLSALIFLATIVTGGILNLDKIPVVVRQVHHVLPYLTLAACAITIYLLVAGQGSQSLKSLLFRS